MSDMRLYLFMIEDLRQFNSSPCTVQVSWYEYSSICVDLGGEPTPKKKVKTKIESVNPFLQQQNYDYTSWNQMLHIHYGQRKILILIVIIAIEM